MNISLKHNSSVKNLSVNRSKQEMTWSVLLTQKNEIFKKLSTQKDVFEDCPAKGRFEK